MLRDTKNRWPIAFLAIELDAKAAAPRTRIATFGIGQGQHSDLAVDPCPSHDQVIFGTVEHFDLTVMQIRAAAARADETI